MRRSALLGFAALLLEAALPATSLGQDRPEPLKLVQKIALPRSFEGRIDHQSVDVKGNRYFLSGLGNGTSR